MEEINRKDIECKPIMTALIDSIIINCNDKSSSVSELCEIIVSDLTVEQCKTIHRMLYIVENQHDYQSPQWNTCFILKNKLIKKILNN